MIVTCTLALGFVTAFSSKADAQRSRKSSRGAQNESAVSFVKDVAPIIVAKCGRCHVSTAKGRYDIKSYDALMNSDSITEGDPEDSFFIEIIESGDMPKGGLTVDDDELKILRDWIAQGAEFDGDDETDVLKRASTSRSGRRRTTGRRPSRSRRNSRPNAFSTNQFLSFFDDDGDGKLSLAEIDAASRLLYSLDANEDDRVTENELREFGK
jgi:mono/diheme cytochrome c family protein